MKAIFDFISVNPIIFYLICTTILAFLLAIFTNPDVEIGTTKLKRFEVLILGVVCIPVIIPVGLAFVILAVLFGILVFIITGTLVGICYIGDLFIKEDS